MATKEDIHIVFKVLNFLKGEKSESFNLEESEKMLLIILASHKGNKGIYPSHETLSKEMKKSIRTIIRICTRLEQKGLLKITRINGKSNNYELLFIEKLSTTCDTAMSGVTSMTPVTTVVTPPVTQLCHTTYDNSCHTIRSEEVDMNKRIEREANSLSVDKFKTEEAKKLCAEKNLDIDEQLKLFKNYYDGNGTVGKFINWLTRARHEEPKLSHPLNAIVDPYEDLRGCWSHLEFSQLRLNTKADEELANNPDLDREELIQSYIEYYQMRTPDDYRKEIVQQEKDREAGKRELTHIRDMLGIRK